MRANFKSSPKATKPVVIFCDCDVPVNHIENLAPEFPAATYLFTRRLFPEWICGNDRELFLHVYEFSQRSYLGGQIFFLTADQGFLQNVSDLEIEDIIRVVVMESASNVSFETARARVKSALQQIFNSCSIER